MTKDKIIDEIERHAQTILNHREDPCQYWKASGCAVSMVHDAEDILELVKQLRDDPA